MGEAYLRRYGVLVTGECPKDGEHNWERAGTDADCYTTGESYDYCTKCGVEANYSVLPKVHTGTQVIDDEFTGNHCGEWGYITFHYECDCGEYRTEPETRRTNRGPHEADPNSTAAHPPCIHCGEFLYF